LEQKVFGIDPLGAPKSRFGLTLPAAATFFPLKTPVGLDSKILLNEGIK
jgi:hypothetical protein